MTDYRGSFPDWQLKLAAVDARIRFLRSRQRVARGERLREIKVSRIKRGAAALACAVGLLPDMSARGAVKRMPGLIATSMSVVVATVSAALAAWVCWITLGALIVVPVLGILGAVSGGVLLVMSFVSVNLCFWFVACPVYRFVRDVTGVSFWQLWVAYVGLIGGALMVGVLGSFICIIAVVWFTPQWVLRHETWKYVVPLLFLILAWIISWRSFARVVTWSAGGFVGRPGASTMVLGRRVCSEMFVDRVIQAELEDLDWKLEKLGVRASGFDRQWLIWTTRRRIGTAVITAMYDSAVGSLMGD